MKHFRNLSNLHSSLGLPPPEHPMISLLKCDATLHASGSLSIVEHTSDFYLIGFKKVKSGTMMYGKTKYDHAQGNMFFVSPRQIVALNEMEIDGDGFLIYFHEDFLIGHLLRSEIRKYSFFEYETSEALHLAPKEEELVWDLFLKMDMEYRNNQDEYSRDIILSHLDSMLKYSRRFYKRQFINRAVLTGKTVSKFNEVLNDYFEKGLVRKKGFPTVTYMASQLGLSPRYLSDLLKQETGKTAIDHIHLFLISDAKNLITAGDQSISEIAYQLGFENLPYFSKLFKKEVGISPNEFRIKLNNN
ncbi:helix-turn-helix domain-containing protein [Mucilaginibacter ginsenosidivorax]|uniref:Helix-turn-helix domain-containing protein n=1 Tax=Mucilaginibacter ginsenosidivorax TaxID=862126 RepID=A0A5B8W3W3_9SPHI|nr:helix-turn-helix transcriptional regulator [Mucilaginibacter ginsenosidivorax]QEC77665.1 helix-turn-helix domain-containing protein [Mucilaginibacter ginsenosidivorax]